MGSVLLSESDVATFMEQLGAADRSGPIELSAEDAEWLNAAAAHLGSIIDAEG